MGNKACRLRCAAGLIAGWVCACLPAGAQQEVPGGPRTGLAPAQAVNWRYTPVNAQLLQFCKERMGQKVGAGQCADLAAQGLRAIGGQPQQADFPDPGDYVWGVLVGCLEARDGRPTYRPGAAGEGGRVRPGDIIQFKGAFFSGGDARWQYAVCAEHHTAVAEDVSADGTYCRVLEQNSGNRQYVVETVLYLPHLRRGTLRVYRPVAAQRELIDSEGFPRYRPGPRLLRAHPVIVADGIVQPAFGTRGRRRTGGLRGQRSVASPEAERLASCAVSVALSALFPLLPPPACAKPAPAPSPAAGMGASRSPR